MFMENFPMKSLLYRNSLRRILTDKISGKSASQQKNRIEEYSNSTGNFTAVPVLYQRENGTDTI